MALSEQDIKVLWSRSGDRCAICKTEITKNGADGWAYPIGVQAHMIARSPKGPRGDASMSAAERDNLDNHILLCPNCHAIVDKDREAWPLDKLRKQKAEHEAEMKAQSKQLPITEFCGHVHVVAFDSNSVIGSHVKTPTRFKPGTTIGVEAYGAKEVTGLKVEVGEGEEG